MNRDAPDAGRYPDPELVQLDRECQEAVRLGEKFSAGLREGGLIATGYVEPVRPDEAPIKVAAEAWDVLKLNFRNASATGNVTKIVRVRIFTPEEYRARAIRSPEGSGETQPDAMGAEMPRGDDEPDGRVVADGPGFPGRPSVMKRIENEMDRRARDGVLEETLAAESRALETWAEQNIHDFQTPKAKSISNALRKKYWRLTGRAPARN